MNDNNSEIDTFDESESEINIISYDPFTINLKNRTKFTLENVLRRGYETHGNAFDYSDIMYEDIHGRNSRISVTCNRCKHKWFPTIHSHIVMKNKCPNCSKNLKWTLERFLIRAKEVNGEKYDYSLITNKHVKGNKSHIPVKCNMCDYQWSPTVNNHITRKTGHHKCS
jgi:ribosomal protein S27E